MVSAPGNPIIVNGNPISSNVGITFECQVPAATGSFTVPSTVLLAMPSNAGATPNGAIQVSLQTLPAALAIPGVDYAAAASVTASVTAQVSFQ